MKKNITWGPKLPKGADENDNKRFYYRNFQQPMLTVMRQRGYLGADLAAALTQEGLYVDGSDKKININKEKMSAEYKDCYL